MSLLSKKCFCLIIASLLLFGMGIPRVMANDCDPFARAIEFLGDQIKKDFLNADNCCSFSAVNCNSLNHITKIKIKNYRDDNADLDSAIKELSSLGYLESLELTNFITNEKHGIPKSLGNLKHLKTLIFSGNSLDFAGSSIPEEISYLTQLVTLDLSNNDLQGSIPKSFGKLKNLKNLNLSKNNLSGTIPYDFKDLINLNELKLDYNTNIKGYVPLLSNLSNCGYNLTNLCYLPNAACKSTIKNCTSEDIKSTNSQNGSPYPNSENFEKPNSYNRSRRGGSSSLFLLIILGFVIFIIYRRRGNKKTSHNKPQNVNNIHNGNSSQPTTTSTTNNVPYPPNNNNNVNTSINVSPSPVQTPYYTYPSTQPDISMSSAYGAPVSPVPVPVSSIPVSSMPVAPVDPTNPTPYNNPPYNGVPYNGSPYNGPMPPYNNGVPYGSMPPYGGSGGYYPPTGTYNQPVAPPGYAYGPYYPGPPAPYSSDIKETNEKDVSEVKS